MVAVQVAHAVPAVPAPVTVVVALERSSRPSRRVPLESRDPSASRATHRPSPVIGGIPAAAFGRGPVDPSGGGTQALRDVADGRIARGAEVPR